MDEVTSPEGQRACRFNGKSFFSAPGMAFLREDLKICVCDDGEWTHIPGRTKEGVEVNDIVDIDKDVVKEEDLTEWPGDNGGNGGSGGSGGSANPVPPNIWDPDSEWLPSSTEPPRVWPPHNTEEATEVWTPDEPDRGSEWTEPPPVWPPHNTEGATEVWTPTPRPGSGGVWTTPDPGSGWPPPRPTDPPAWTPPPASPCSYQKKVYPHAPSSPVVGPTHVCFCDDGQWKGCKLKGKATVWHDDGDGTVCTYLGKAYAHGPGVPVVGPTHVCYCDRGVWVGCKLKGKAVGSTGGGGHKHRPAKQTSSSRRRGTHHG